MQYTVADMLRKGRTAARTNPARRAVVFGDQEVTFDELDERSSRLASGLAARGFTKGERVAVLLHNRIEYLEIFFALAKLGGVIVPVNYLFKTSEVAHLLEDSEARWMFVEERLQEAVRSLDDSVVAKVTVVALDASDAGSTAYEEVVTSGDPAGVGAEVAAEDLLLLQYTSGTTGFPKGAMHTHATVMWNSLHQVADFSIAAGDTYLCVPALCWAAGLHDFTLPVLWAGGVVVLNPSGGLDPTALLASLEKHRATITLLVPSVLRMVLAETLEDYDLSPLRFVLSGGEPVPVPAIEDFQSRLPDCELVQGYGMSEFPTIMTFLSGSDAVSKRGSAGRANRITELRVVDPNGVDTEAGEHGEIVVRSPATTDGYYERASDTAQAFRNGYFHTGDRGYVDEDGYLYIAGRSKDMIISGGLNVYPAEIERVLETHPAVAEVAIVGTPDDKYGEMGKAVVVLANGAASVTEAELETHVRRDLASYKVPKRWVLRSEPLPRTASGKVQKFALRDS